MKYLVLAFTLCSYLIATNHDDIKKIEIFDIKGSLIKTAQSTPLIQKEVRNYINGIKSVNNKLNPIQNNGNIIKISFNKALLIQNNILNQYITEVYIILPEKEEPSIMIFDDENTPNFYILNAIKADILSLFGLSEQPPT
jgi:hypothetical protein